MQRDRPYLAAFLTIVGGAFVVVGGLLLAIVGTVLAHLLGFSSAVFYVGLVVGLLTMLVGALMLVVPSARRGLGFVAIALAVASIPFAFGGLVVGFVLTAIGGAAAAVRPRWVVIATPGSPGGPAPPWT